MSTSGQPTNPSRFAYIIGIQRHDMRRKLGQMMRILSSHGHNPSTNSLLIPGRELRNCGDDIREEEPRIGRKWSYMGDPFLQRRMLDPFRRDYGDHKVYGVGVPGEISVGTDDVCDFFQVDCDAGTGGCGFGGDFIRAVVEEDGFHL